MFICQLCIILCILCLFLPNLLRTLNISLYLLGDQINMFKPLKHKYTPITQRPQAVPDGEFVKKRMVIVNLHAQNGGVQFGTQHKLTFDPKLYYSIVDKFTLDLVHILSNNLSNNLYKHFIIKSIAVQLAHGHNL